MQDEMFDVVPDFDGFHYEPKKDKDRLTGQIKSLHDFMNGPTGMWFTVQELAFSLGFPEPSISAQLRNLRKERFGGHNVKGRYREGTRIFEYRLEDK
jgi:hypothetical protein